MQPQLPQPSTQFDWPAPLMTASEVAAVLRVTSKLSASTSAAARCAPSGCHRYLALNPGRSANPNFHPPGAVARVSGLGVEPAEVLRVLLAEEAAGRDRATIQMRRRTSALPAGKTFDAWDQSASPIPAATQQAAHAGVDRPR